MNKHAIKTNKKFLPWGRFAITCVILTFLNLLILYFFPRNIYSDLAFVLIVFFVFKFLSFSGINIFFYSIIYLIIAAVVALININILSSRWLDSTSFYILALFILAILAYLYEQKLEEKISFSKRRILYLCFSCIFSVLFIFLFVSLNLEQPSTKTIVRSTKTIVSSTKQSINRIFKKQEYYSKKEIVIINGEKVKEEITISASSSKQGSTFSGKIKIEGWAMEKNAEYDSGIDRIEFFLDGKPGEGKYLGKFSQNYDPELETKKFIKNLYFNFYDRPPDSSELNFLAINLEYDIMSYYEVADNIIRKSGFTESSLSNEDFLGRLYTGLLNRDWDGSWISELENGLSREDILYTIINSIEFNKLSESYYNNITIKNNYLDVIKKDDGIKYGKQFLLSGFSFEFDSTAFPDGEHTLYIYAHSPIFGWDYMKINLIIDNNF
jgi:hypothetical protein